MLGVTEVMGWKVQERLAPVLQEIDLGSTVSLV